MEALKNKYPNSKPSAMISRHHNSSMGINGGLINTQKHQKRLLDQIHNYFPPKTHQTLLASCQQKIFSAKGVSRYYE